MLVVHNPHHAGHAGRHEMFRGRRVRLEHVLKELPRCGFHEPSRPDDGPAPAFEDLLSRVHSPRYLHCLRGAWEERLVFEGGYAVAEVGVNTVNVLEGFVNA